MPADRTDRHKPLTIHIRHPKKKTLSRPSEPEDVVGGSDDDLHQPERCQTPPDEPTTVIGKKIKKQKKRTGVTDDNFKSKENPCESDPTIKTKTASDLNYSCNVDKVSEAQIVDAVHCINYSIDNLISNILDRVKTFKQSYHYTLPLSSKPISYPIPIIEPTDSSNITCITLWSMLIDFRPPHGTKDLVVEAALRNLIYSLLHKHFFNGGHFFGVGSETLHGYLETMLSKLVAGENSDPIAIQRWRSMSVEAVFQMNDGIEAQLNDQLIAGLDRVLNVACPLELFRRRFVRSTDNQLEKYKPSKSSYESIVLEEQHSLLDIIHQARRLSFMIQHEIVSCQVLVTIAPPSPDTQTSSDGSTATATTSTGDALGTYAFGLQKILGSRRSILIHPKVITSAQFTT